MKLLLRKNPQPRRLVLKRSKAPQQVSLDKREERRIIAPQPGPQTRFAQSSADIVIYGGQAGGGKSYALLLEALRNVATPGYAAVIFRKTHAEVKNEGGLWDRSSEIYPLVGGVSTENNLTWKWTSGATVAFGHLQHEKNKLDWQGSEIAFLGFDELTHFSQSQFFYMLSRNRTTCGVPSYVRCTCNPDADSWVARLISWWIDDKGYPIASRDGVVRWFIRGVDDQIVWGDTKEELASQCKDDQEPKSLTFIKSTLEDNPALMSNDPAYRSTLAALPLVDRLRLMKGNWKIRPTQGMAFKREWFEIVDAAPVAARTIRYWDRAATPEDKSGNTDPDYTAGVRMSRSPQGLYYVEHVSRFRASPHLVETTIKNLATADGRKCQVWLEEDPGQAGRAEISYLIRSLVGHDVHANRVQTAKWVRAKPLSAQAEAGNVKIVRGPWNDAFLAEMEAFVDEDLVDVGEGYHDDQVDGASGAFNMLCSIPSPRIR